MNGTVLQFVCYADRVYNLDRLPIPVFVHDARFHLHGVAIRYRDGSARFQRDVAAALVELEQDLGEGLAGTTVVFHDAHLPMYVLNHVYRIRPRYFIDTALLANLVFGPVTAKARHGALAGSSVGSAISPQSSWGVRYPNGRQLADLAEQAVEVTKRTFTEAKTLIPLVSRTPIELKSLMHSVRLFSERGLCVDTESIDRVGEQIRAEARDAVRAAGIDTITARADEQFTPILAAALARSGRLLPRKRGHGGSVPAFARSDPEMLDLLEDDDPLAAALAMARLKSKGEVPRSRQIETLTAITTATGGIRESFSRSGGDATRTAKGSPWYTRASRRAGTRTGLP